MARRPTLTRVPDPRGEPVTTTAPTPAARIDITRVLPAGGVVEVTLTDAGTRKRITGTVTGYTRAGRWPFRRDIDGVWVGDAWVSTEDALSSETRILQPGWPVHPLTNDGIRVPLAHAAVGDVLYAAFPHGDAVVQALGPVDIIDEHGEWVGLDGDMTLAAGVPYFTIRRVTAAAEVTP